MWSRPTHPLCIAALVLAGALPAGAQGQNCAPRAQVVERLSAHYGETRQSMGLGHNNAVMELFANPDGGTWTITVTMSDGMTCLVASGQAFEEMADVLPSKGDDV